MPAYKRILKSTATYGSTKEYIESRIKSSVASDNFYTTGSTLGSDNILTGSLTGSTTWTGDLTALAPLTTKGDIYAFSDASGLPTRLPSGTDSYALVADSTTDTGLNWASNDDANYYTSSYTFGTDSKITGSMTGGGSAWSGTALTTFTPATTFTTGAVFGGNSTAAGYITFLPDTDDSVSGTTLQAGINTEAQTYTLPLAYPDTSGFALVSTDAGVMSWATAAGANYYVTGRCWCHVMGNCSRR